MEKRVANRHPLATPIICRHFSAANSAISFNGIMKNCSLYGMYAELEACFEVGTFLVIRVTGGSAGYSKDQGFQSLAVAEVKWSKLIPADERARYATGLKYVIV